MEIVDETNTFYGNARAQELRAPPNSTTSSDVSPTIPPVNQSQQLNPQTLMTLFSVIQNVK